MRSAVLPLLALCLPSCASPSPSLDLVLIGGRVIDPETGLDGIRNVGIRGDSIRQVTSRPLAGARVIDLRGLVVAPGFIAVNQHVQSLEAYRFMALDGSRPPSVRR